MDRIAALVFAKPPRPGHVKTRLAASVGDAAAATVAAALLADTLDALRARPDLDVILSTPEPDADHGARVDERWDQGPGDLGARLERAFRRALATYPRALAVGADTPGIPPAWLDPLCAGSDAVLAPTDDGGFWALALSRCPEGLFSGIRWSASTTAAETRARLRDHALAVVDGPRWFDVDEGADLARVRREVPRERAPRTHAALDALGWAP